METNKKIRELAENNPDLADILKERIPEAFESDFKMRHDESGEVDIYICDGVILSNDSDYDTNGEVYIWVDNNIDFVTHESTELQYQIS